MRPVLSILTAATLALASVAASAQAIELKALSTFDNRYAATGLAFEKFLEGAKAATQGRITYRISGPEVVPPAEQIQPLQKGAFDLLFTVQPWHMNVAGGGLGLNMLQADPEGWRAKGVFDYLDREYQKSNVKLLAIIPGSATSENFHVMLKEEIKPGADLAGRKLRANPAYKGFTDTLHASMVTLSAGEIYSALQRGTIDGVVWPVNGALDFKWYEQARYMMKPRWGTSIHFILMNLERYQKLSPADRTVLDAEARKVEVSAMNALTALAQKELDELKAKGMKETTLPAEKFKPALEAFNQGLWDLAFNSKASGADARKFHEFLKSKGLMP